VRRFENYEVMLDRDGEPIELGRGAMGITYKAFDIDLRFPVTLKVISEKYVSNESARLRFLREARAAAKVRHPNVASVLHLGRTGSGYFYAMEFVDGETLESLIKRSGRLEVKPALEIAAQVAAGLAAVHKQSLVHRDIKPSNIMVALEPGGALMAKIIDLGLAKGVSEYGSESEISTAGVFAGTPAFASPEQFAGLGADIRSDLYSLGVTLWEMLVGQVPFRGSPSELMHEHRQAPLPLEQLKGLPQPVVILLEVMLEKDPAQRFQDPAELLRAISLVTAAITAGRSVTPQDLRAVSGEGLAAFQKAQKFSGRVKGLFRSSRVRLFAWLMGGLLIGGIVILAINGFFRVNHPAAKSPVTPSALIKAPEKSIAVLPFDNISPNKDDSYFADGVQDEILNNLAKVAQLKVISRTSVMQYRAGAERDLRQIAAALGVANVLEGTVRRDGNHVRVSTELVDASNDNTIWADSYDRDLTDIFAIQSEIAQQVASRLNAQLSPEERKDIDEKPTANLAAYDLFLQAKQLINFVGLWSSDKQNLLKAISLLEQAIHLDPAFALAYCKLSDAHGMLYNGRVDHTPERLALSDAVINEALRLRPDLGEVHLGMAWHLWGCYHDVERARVQLGIAAQTLPPNNPDLLYLAAVLDRYQGQWDKATAGLERVVTLDPRNPDLLENLAWTYGYLRRYRDKERILDRLIEIEPDQPVIAIEKVECAFYEKADLGSVRAAYEALPASMKDEPDVTFSRIYYALCARDFAGAKEILSKGPNGEIFFYEPLIPRQILALWVEFLQGNHPTMEAFGAAREQLYRKFEADPSEPYLLMAVALSDVALGHTEEGMQEGRRAMEMRPLSEDATGGPIIATYFALVCAWANQPDAAFAQLEILVKIPCEQLNYGDLKTYPGWDPLRKDPRFDKLLAELAPPEPAGKSIAVLPFESLSDNKSDAYFADGVQDEILNNLAKIAQLKVISRTSVMQYRADTKRDLRQIAAALGVANVLEGTVRRAGDHVRVSTELVDARNDTTIWADSYDRDLTDIFTIQSDIAQTVASRLSAQLSPQEEKSIGEKPTDNLEAYDLYLQAKHLLQANYYILPSNEKEIYSKVISLLEKAIQNDGKFALAYCLLTKAHDILYVDGIDHTPARVALGDAAVNEALRLRLDLPEAHLALAAHLYRCYRDFERAQVQIAIARQTLSNNSDLLELTARIGREQGRWEHATAALERAATLDPRNPQLLETLSDTYSCLRRFQDAERILDRVIQLEPNQPERLLIRVWYLFSEKADVTAARAACASLPPSTKDDPYVTSYRVYYAMCARDYAAAEEILSEGPNKEIFFLGALVPRQIFALWIQFLRGNHPTMEEFGTAREQLYRKVVGAYADAKSAPTDPYLLMALAYADMALGRKEDSIQEGRHATELRPISEDAYHGPTIALDFAALYGLVDQVEVAFQQLNSLVKIPGWQLNYGNLKNNPAWDPLRKDPRFDKLLAQLAPRD
jgi:TolB-like protein/Tfp pilus assembly protein PilF